MKRFLSIIILISILYAITYSDSTHVQYIVEDLDDRRSLPECDSSQIVPEFTDSLGNLVGLTYSNFGRFIRVYLLKTSIASKSDSADLIDSTVICPTSNRKFGFYNLNSGEYRVILKVPYYGGVICDIDNILIKPESTSVVICRKERINVKSFLPQVLNYNYPWIRWILDKNDSSWQNSFYDTLMNNDTLESYWRKTKKLR